MLRLLAFAFICLPACALNYDSDVPQPLKAQLESDLAMIASIQGNGVSGLHRDIFGSVDGATYKTWFASRAKSIGLDDCGSASAVACVNPGFPSFDSSKVWITPNYTKFSHPQIARLMILYHEARHTEREHWNWPHADCPTPHKNAAGDDIKSIWTGIAVEGKPACDETEKGSYGSSLILLKNIQKFCANCTEKVKMDAGFYADDQMLRMIDDGAIQAIRKDLYAPEANAAL